MSAGTVKSRASLPGCESAVSGARSDKSAVTVVIADTSPINYLVMIGEAGILERLYGRVLITKEVMAELVDAGAPAAVRAWAMGFPKWVEIRKGPTPDVSLGELDAGEASAIALAETEGDVLLLIDEAAGRREANRRGIRNTGTLGVLRSAAVAGLVDLAVALERLRGTNFRASRTLVEGLLAEDLERRQG